MDLAAIVNKFGRYNSLCKSGKEVIYVHDFKSL